MGDDPPGKLHDPPLPPARAAGARDRDDARGPAGAEGAEGVRHLVVHAALDDLGHQEGVARGPAGAEVDLVGLAGREDVAADPVLQDLVAEPEGPLPEVRGLVGGAAEGVGALDPRKGDGRAHGVDKVELAARDTLVVVVVGVGARERGGPVTVGVERRRHVGRARGVPEDDVDAVAGHVEEPPLDVGLGVALVVVHGAELLLVGEAHRLLEGHADILEQLVELPPRATHQPRRRHGRATAVGVGDGEGEVQAVLIVDRGSLRHAEGRVGRQEAGLKHVVIRIGDRCHGDGGLGEGRGFALRHQIFGSP